MTTNTKTLLECALDYASKGFKIFPCGPDKKPHTEHGFYDGTTDIKQVKEWWNKYPNAGIGWWTEKHIVLDVDNKLDKNGIPSVGDASFIKLQEDHGPLPKTRKHLSGSHKGYHHIYQNPTGDKIGNYPLKLTYPGLDIRADAGYILLPPSPHEAGFNYEVLNDCPVVSAPDWFVKLLTTTKQKDRPVVSTVGKITSGFQDDWLYHRACSYRGNGDDETAIFEKLKLDVRRCDVDPNKPYTDKDFLRIARSACTHEPCTENNSPLPDSDLPGINVTSRHLRDITTDALEALYKANNPPTIFVRSGVLSRLGVDETNRPYIETMSESAVRGYLARACNFTRMNDKGQVAIAPPLDVVRDVMSRGSWGIPPLAGIIQSPALRPDGSIISEPGYDKTTALYYVPSDGLEVSVIPDKPSSEDIKKAVFLITEVFCDIPFDSSASKANAYGAFISPILRPAIKGTIPLPLVDKPMPGTGASLLTDIISIVATGHMAATMGVCQSEEEWEKKLSSQLLAGRSLCVIDNIEGKLQSDTLSRYLTSSEISIRPLGRTADIIVPNKMSFFATGINIKLGGDIPRRCYHIRLDAGVARPWQRDIVYKHPELREWALNNRGQILGAILTVARAWYVAGQPIPDDLPKMGGFENYSRVIGGVLSFVKMPGFLSNLTQMYDSMDVDTPQWEAFLTAWYELLGDTPVLVAEVVKHLNDNEEFAESLPEKLATRDGRDYSRRLGNALRSRDNVQLPCGLTLNRDGERKHATLWKVSYKKANSPTLASKVS